MNQRSEAPQTAEGCPQGEKFVLDKFGINRVGTMYEGCLSSRKDYAPVAQLDRVPGYELGGRTFESCRVRHTHKRAQLMLGFFVCMAHPADSTCPFESRASGADSAPSALPRRGEDFG